jgi:hypothetical protein
MSLSPTERLLLAYYQADNLLELLKGNEYQNYFEQHLYPIKVELERQLKNDARKTVSD